MESKNLKISGMHCSACEMLIKDILEEVNIKVENISHKTGTLKISYDDKNISLIEIEKILLEEGYKNKND